MIGLYHTPHVETKGKRWKGDFMSLTRILSAITIALAALIILDVTVRAGAIAPLIIIGLKEDDETTPAAELKLLVLGDSIAKGWGVSESQSFGAKLADALNASEYNNFAVNGLETSGLINKLMNNDFPASAEGQDIIILSIGGNDIFQPFLRIAKQAVGLPPTASDVELAIQTELFAGSYELIAKEIETNRTLFEKAVEDYYINMQSILMALRIKNPNALIYTLNHYNPFTPFGGSALVRGFTGEMTERMNVHLARLTEEFSFGIIDINSEIGVNTAFYMNIVSFDPHPNGLGHEKIFAVAYEAVLRGEQSAGRFGMMDVLQTVTQLAAGMVEVMAELVRFITANILLLLPFGTALIYFCVRLLRKLIKVTV